MAEVTVSELAKVVGASVDRLLGQMKDAGLPHSNADDKVSDEEKQALLTHLKGLHGDKSREPKKITLKRKSVSTLKAGAGRKTVNVEVRKKRTYVKRSAEELAAAAEAEEQSKVEAPVESAPKAPLVDDIEAKRLAAIEARREAEEQALAKKAEEDEARKQEETRKQEEANRKAAEDAAAPEQADAAAKHAKKHFRHEAEDDTDKDDDKPKKKRGPKT